MKLLIELFKSIYEKSLGLFVSRETGEIFTRAAFVAAVLATIAAVYAIYAAAISAISLALPAPFDYALIFLPDNTTAVLTVLTTARVGFYIASLKLGLASVGVK
jgi:hypothetical protein